MSTTTTKKTGEVEEEKKGTLRSTVYTIAVLVEVIWMIFLVLELIWILTQVLNVDQDKPNWDVIVVVSLVKSYISSQLILTWLVSQNHLQHVMKKILLFILHLGKILVPVFSSSQQRAAVQICFMSLALLDLTCLAVSDVYWLLNIEQEPFLYNMNDFFTEGIVYIVMATAFIYIILDTLDDSSKLGDQGKRYGFELMISK